MSEWEKAHNGSGVFQAEFLHSNGRTKEVVCLTSDSAS